MGGNAEYDTKLLRFHYTSLVTPSSVFDYDMETRERELKKQQEVLGGYDPSQYQSERIYATAPDGVQVPISLVYKKGFARDGHAPMLLYGYGSYGISIDPIVQLGPAEPARPRLCLSPSRISAAAAIWASRGTKTAGCSRRKIRSPISSPAPKHLIAERYTSPDRLAIMGGSAGGLLVGAVINMRPDLFARGAGAGAVRRFVEHRRWTRRCR